MPPLAASQNAYSQAISTLKGGGLVVLPTETVYGVAALATADNAVRKIYAAKGRQFDKPLSIGVWSAAMFDGIVQSNALIAHLAQTFWPGPLTLVAPEKPNSGISPLCNPGGSSLGVRYPNAPWAQAFASAGFNTPIALTSANISGRAAAITAQDAASQLGRHVDLIIDGGTSAIGVASTVIKVDGKRAAIVRPGGIAPEHLAPYPLELDHDN